MKTYFLGAFCLATLLAPPALLGQEENYALTYDGISAKDQILGELEHIRTALAEEGTESSIDRLEGLIGRIDALPTVMHIDSEVRRGGIVCGADDHVEYRADELGRIGCYNAGFKSCVVKDILYLETIRRPNPNSWFKSVRCKMRAIVWGYL